MANVASTRTNTPSVRRGINYGNGHKGLKFELIELKAEINTFKKIAVWQVGILIAILLRMFF